MTIRARNVRPDPSAVTVVHCPACRFPLVKGQPRGRFTIGCRSCRQIVEVVVVAEEQATPAAERVEVNRVR